LRFSDTAAENANVVKKFSFILRCFYYTAILEIIVITALFLGRKTGTKNAQTIAKKEIYYQMVIDSSVRWW
jgi:hypothetical protein